MGLCITALEFENFRNYGHYALDGIGGLTIFTGDNGVGKTNVLEGIQLLASSSSFRHPQISQMVRQGASSARLDMDIADGRRELSARLTLEPGKKHYTVNGKKRNPTDARVLLPAVAFTPDDLQLAKRSSSVRREALDDLGSQLSRNYHVIRRDYEKALRYKNRLLKEEAAAGLVEAMNETFLTCATQLYCYRHALFKKMSSAVEDSYEEIATSGERFGASYLPSWDYLANGEKDPGIAGFDGAGADKGRVRSCLEGALSRFSAEERVRRRSIVGPHNDKLAFYLDGRDASSFASQGQQRSIVLAWKLAEVEVVRQTVGTNPVLLLDDVMSELDGRRRAMLVESVGDGIQTFITATDLSPFDSRLLSRGRVVELKRARA